MPSRTRNQVDAGTADLIGRGLDVDQFQGGRLARATCLKITRPAGQGQGHGKTCSGGAIGGRRVGTGRPTDGWRIEVHGGMQHSRGIQETRASPWGWLGAKDIGRRGKLAAGAQLGHPESAGHLTYFPESVHAGGAASADIILSPGWMWDLGPDGASQRGRRTLSRRGRRLTSLYSHRISQPHKIVSPASKRYIYTSTNL